MDVILLEKIANLGNLGDKVSVKSGYGRNFLIPFSKAVPANKENVEAFEARRAELEKAATANLAAAEKRAAEMAEVELTLTAKSGDEGKLFGSIGPRDLAEAITGAGMKVAKSEIRMADGPIRATGEYDIAIQLHTDVAATIKVYVEAE
ncbi:50S ribosomal protein L9 [Endozoicomonas sp. OPT23]|uniref:50S ribosomal protein L9 n=1 Tax=Endozoicomonas sp. OPT23 TaxID=2072845 RepID=UPI00129AE111|nr:50S ribosomal protein L9 [Endozoicomonas sp. OPT23]MRI31702.1 50S ribosomal protein L9 [Endozoicomonas sp. OPT23]